MQSGKPGSPDSQRNLSGDSVLGLDGRFVGGNVLSNVLRKGLWVFIALFVLTVAEYIMAVAIDSGNLPYMIVMNVVDAALIMYFFMHVAQLWRREEE